MEVFWLFLGLWFISWGVGSIIVAIDDPRKTNHGFKWKMACMFLFGWEIVLLWNLSGTFLVSAIRLELPPILPYWFFGPLGWWWYYSHREARD